MDFIFFRLFRRNSPQAFSADFFFAQKSVKKKRKKSAKNPQKTEKFAKKRKKSAKNCKKMLTKKEKSAKCESSKGNTRPNKILKNSNSQEITNMEITINSTVEVSRIADWALREKFTSLQLSAIDPEGRVERETEKAVFVAFGSDFGFVRIWLPKCAILSDEQLAAESARRAAAQNRGLAYNDLLKKVCRENGIRICGKFIKTATLIAKLTAAGVPVPAR